MAMIGTAICDYCLFGGCIAFFLFCCCCSNDDADEGKEGSSSLSSSTAASNTTLLTSFQSVWFLATLLNAIHIRDYFWLYVLPHHLTCKEKRNYQGTLMDVYYVIKQYVLFLSLTGSLTKLEFFDIQFDSTKPFQEIVCKLLPQFYVIALLKDNTGMRFLHPLMHDGKNKSSTWLHTIHQEHHSTRKELRVLTTFHGDWPDLLLETAGGPILYLVACGLIGWPLKINIISWFMIVWMDINCHSINPYTVVFWNPILDDTFKANICHNLHHIYYHDGNYFMFIPLHHLLSLKGGRNAREADIQRYNDVMGTNISFDWFLYTNQQR